MKHYNFDDYLMEVCFTQNIYILDDDQPDFYNEWLDNLSVDEWIEYGEKYKNKCVDNLIELIKKEN